MQLQLFRNYIVDDLGVLGGVTCARSIRASDNLTYVVKDDTADVQTVRAAEFLWLSIAQATGLPAPTPVVIEDRTTKRMLLGTRKEQAAIGRDHNSCLNELLSGQVSRASEHLSRIFAFDLFSANWDRHPGNYLVLDDGGTKVVFAIDFSHVRLLPSDPSLDPTLIAHCATRAYFPIVIEPYGHDNNAALDMVSRLATLPAAKVEAILTDTPDEWMAPSVKADVLAWWNSPARNHRAQQIAGGLASDAYF